jgi:hypothetical protein
LQSNSTTLSYKAVQTCVVSSTNVCCKQYKTCTEYYSVIDDRIVSLSLYIYISIEQTFPTYHSLGNHLSQRPEVAAAGGGGALRGGGGRTRAERSSGAGGTRCRAAAPSLQLDRESRGSSLTSPLAAHRRPPVASTAPARALLQWPPSGAPPLARGSPVPARAPLSCRAAPLAACPHARELRSPHA